MATSVQIQNGTISAMYHKFKQRYRYEIHKNIHSLTHIFNHIKKSDVVILENVKPQPKKGVDGRTSTSGAYEKDIVTIIRGDTC